MANCMTCLNSVFDETWGEYKCKVYQHRIYDVEQYNLCDEYKPNKDKIKTEPEAIKSNGKRRRRTK